MRNRAKGEVARMDVEWRITLRKVSSDSGTTPAATVRSGRRARSRASSSARRARAAPRPQPSHPHANSASCMRALCNRPATLTSPFPSPFHPLEPTHLLSELVPEVAVHEQLGEDAYDEQQHRSELHAQHAYLRTDKSQSEQVSPLILLVKRYH